MTDMTLYRAINQIDDELILEACETPLKAAEKSRLKIISQICAAAAVFVIVICLGLYSNDALPFLNSSQGMSGVSSQKPSSQNQSNQDSQAVGDNQTTSNQAIIPQKDFSTYTLEKWIGEEEVIWRGDSSGLKGDGVIKEKAELGGVLITDKLKELFKGNGDDSIYAVLVDFTSCIDEKEVKSFEYNGTTIAELEKEMENNRKIVGYIPVSEGNEDGTHKEYMQPIYEYTGKYEGKTEQEWTMQIDEIRETYYKMRYEAFKDTFSKNKLNMYREDFRGYSTGFFYTFATKAQLEGFKCKASEAFVFAPAVKFK